MKGKKIYNIEALRKRLNCETYAELENYGYDVDGYFSEQKYKKHFTSRANSLSKHSYDDGYHNYDETAFMNFSDPTRDDYMGT